jgi:hypothetical protein
MRGVWRLWSVRRRASHRSAAPLRRARIALLVLALALAALALPSGAGATGTLDQEQGLDNRFGIASYALAQTFTPAVNGELTELELPLEGPSPNPAPKAVDVYITEVDGEGRPAESILASALEPGSSLPEHEHHAFVPVTFAEPALLSAGTRYAIVLYNPEFFNPETEAEHPAFWWGGSKTGYDERGEPWSSQSATAPFEWKSLRKRLEEEEPTTLRIPDVQLAFRTFMEKQCTTAIGHDSYLRVGEPGRLLLREELSTNLIAPERLLVSYPTENVKFHLLHLEAASCRNHVFSANGTAAVGTQRGYTVSFSLSEKAGQLFFQYVLRKGSEVVHEGHSGPMGTVTDKIE